MLSRIFKTRDPLSQPDSAARRRAVEGLSDAKAGELQERLLELARGDGDPGVRQACLSRLQHASDVAQLLDDESMANRAAERLDELLVRRAVDVVRDALPVVDHARAVPLRARLR